MLRNQWSGKEDSNLRPLPPEGTGPPVLRRISVATRRTRPSHSGTDSLSVPGARFIADLRPLSVGVV